MVSLNVGSGPDPGVETERHHFKGGKKTKYYRDVKRSLLGQSGMEHRDSVVMKNLRF